MGVQHQWSQTESSGLHFTIIAGNGQLNILC